MANFTVAELSHYNTTRRVFKLFREDKCYLDEFISEIKNDANLKPELGDLIPVIKDVANGKSVPKTKYRKLKMGKLLYSVYEAKSKHLRLYLFLDQNGMIILLGGKKTTQNEDLGKIKKILKEYHTFNTKTK